MPNNLPARDLEKLLERVAHKAYSEALISDDFAENVYVRVMARELLPLLEAGDVGECRCTLRERDSGHLVGCWKVAWDAALKAALERK